MSIKNNINKFPCKIKISNDYFQINEKNILDKAWKY